MNTFRKWFGQQGNGSDANRPPLKKVAADHADHGRHFYFLQALGDPSEAFTHIVHTMMTPPARPSAIEHEGIVHLCDATGELMFSVLAKDEDEGLKLFSAYPYDDTGYGWPIEVREIYEWPNGEEAQLMGSCHGAGIGFFDTFYFRHKHRYRQGEVLTFLIAGLAYTMERGEVPEGFADEFSAYMPVLGADGIAVDECQFASRVEDVNECDFWGVPLLKYTLTLARPADFPMRLDIYHYQDANTERFAVGDRVQGVAWLFGYAPLP